MHSFLKWLGRKLFGKKPEKPTSLYQTGRRISPGAPSAHPAPQRPAKARAAQPRKRPASFADIAGAALDDLEDGGDQSLLGNRYVREETGTHETLKIFSDSALESEEEPGFDPYNTGRFDRGKHWNGRTRE